MGPGSGKDYYKANKGQQKGKRLVQNGCDPLPTNNE